MEQSTTKLIAVHIAAILTHLLIIIENVAKALRANCLLAAAAAAAAEQ